jgi:hypothetical protein
LQYVDYVGAAFCRPNHYAGILTGSNAAVCGCFGRIAEIFVLSLAFPETCDIMSAL